MNVAEIKSHIANKTAEMANAISKGKDIEIVKTSSGIAIKEVSKKKIE